MILFLVGVMVGGCLGIIVMGLLVAARSGDDYLRRIEHTCGTRCEPLANLHRTEWGERV